MKPVQLNNTHRDLRIVTTRGAAWGDELLMTISWPSLPFTVLSFVKPWQA